MYSCRFPAFHDTVLSCPAATVEVCSASPNFFAYVPETWTARTPVRPVGTVPPNPPAPVQFPWAVAVCSSPAAAVSSLVSSPRTGTGPDSYRPGVARRRTHTCSVDREVPAWVSRSSGNAQPSPASSVACAANASGVTSAFTRSAFRLTSGRCWAASSWRGRTVPPRIEVRASATRSTPPKRMRPAPNTLNGEMVASGFPAGSAFAGVSGAS
ncbi:hypothetical protein GCM10025787_02640 [Saccharopolyspora rosea]